MKKKTVHYNIFVKWAEFSDKERWSFGKGRRGRGWKVEMYAVAPGFLRANQPTNSHHCTTRLYSPVVLLLCFSDSACGQLLPQLPTTNYSVV